MARSRDVLFPRICTAPTRAKPMNPSSLSWHCIKWKLNWVTVITSHEGSDLVGRKPLAMQGKAAHKMGRQLSGAPGGKRFWVLVPILLGTCSSQLLTRKDKSRGEPDLRLITLPSIWKKHCLLELSSWGQTPSRQEVDLRLNVSASHIASI